MVCGQRRDGTSLAQQLGKLRSCGIELALSLFLLLVDANDWLLLEEVIVDRCLNDWLDDLRQHCWAGDGLHQSARHGCTELGRVFVAIVCHQQIDMLAQDLWQREHVRTNWNTCTARAGDHQQTITGRSWLAQIVVIIGVQRRVQERHQEHRCAGGSQSFERLFALRRRHALASQRLVGNVLHGDVGVEERDQLACDRQLFAGAATVRVEDLKRFLDRFSFAQALRHRGFVNSLTNGVVGCRGNVAKDFAHSVFQVWVG